MYLVLQIQSWPGYQTAENFKYKKACIKALTHWKQNRKSAGIFHTLKISYTSATTFSATFISATVFTRTFCRGIFAVLCLVRKVASNKIFHPWYFLLCSLTIFASSHLQHINLHFIFLHSHTSLKKPYTLSSVNNRCHTFTCLALPGCHCWMALKILSPYECAIQIVHVFHDKR